MKQICISFTGSAKHIAERISEWIDKGWLVIAMATVEKDVVIIFKKP